MFKVYNSPQEVTPGPIEWLKLSFASCVIHETRSLGALVLLYSTCSMVFVNEIYDMDVDTQFHKFYGRLFARVLYRLLKQTIKLIRINSRQ